MDVRHIDHVNIKIPPSRVDEAIEFYRDGLGFEPEGLDAYRNGDRPIFSFRLGDRSVVHVRPGDDFEPPSNKNYDHAAFVVDQPIDKVKSQLRSAGISVVREGNPLGATGRAPAVYIKDPFGFTIELKEATGPPASDR